MNDLKNNVQLFGRIGNDIDMSNENDSYKYAKFSLAVNENYVSKDGKKESKTAWFNIVAWNKTAELCDRLLKKGDEILLQGKLVNNVYEDKEGNKRTSTSVNMSKFIITQSVK